MLKKHKFTVLFVSWVVFVTLLSLFSIPTFETEDSYFITIPHLDKIVHFTFYTVMVVFGYLFANERFKLHYTSYERVLMVMLFSIFYGIIIEVLQSLPFSNRTSEIWDVVANSVGVVTGGIFAHSRIFARFS